jgi:hypothetical protein
MDLMNNYLHQLRRITGELLSPELYYLKVRHACLDLFTFFTDSTGLDLNDKKNQEHIPTQAGLAVSPYAAAYCVQDFMRTRIFLLGIKEAIDTKLKENPGKPVKILYAGTGPFATLAVPLMAIYGPSDLQFVLMDINPISIKYLQGLIQRLQLQPWIINVVQADATSYTIPDGDKPDIVLSETMKPGLHKEPQVSVVSNLISQCDENTILIPENIKIEVMGVGNLTNSPDAISRFQTLFELNALTARQIKNNPAAVPVIAGGIITTIPDNIDKRLSVIVLGTGITVFNSHRLGQNDSSLTIFHSILSMNTIKTFPAKLLCRYSMKDKPGFSIAVL